jgi:hypothetical protein
MFTKNRLIHLLKKALNKTFVVFQSIFNTAQLNMVRVKRSYNYEKRKGGSPPVMAVSADVRELGLSFIFC